MTREELYRKFGPKLVEAVVSAMNSELNLLRVQVGAPEITDQEIIDMISDKLDGVPDYDWMSDVN